LNLGLDKRKQMTSNHVGIEIVIRKILFHSP
jgi:hypothetical protein